MTGSSFPGIRRVLLFINLHKAEAHLLADEMIGEFRRMGIETYSFYFQESPQFSADDKFDICFTLGGDGTVLYAARIVAPWGVPILPIHLGTLGFIAAVQPGEWRDVFRCWCEGRAVVSQRLMLELRVERRGETVVCLSCLNDVVIAASGIAKIIRLRVEAETEITGAADGPSYLSLGSYRSDGLIVATPTGSTAYSVAAGGPILDPEIAAIIINPICPFTLSNRPIVVPAHETIRVEVEAEQRSGVLLTVDGQVTELLEPGDQVYIRAAPYEARLIASDREVFYRALRTKLNWSGGPDA